MRIGGLSFGARGHAWNKLGSQSPQPSPLDPPLLWSYTVKKAGFVDMQTPFPHTSRTQNRNAILYALNMLTEVVTRKCSGQHHTTLVPPPPLWYQGEWGVISSGGLKSGFEGGLAEIEFPSKRHFNVLFKTFVWGEGTLSHLTSHGSTWVSQPGCISPKNVILCPVV